MIDEATMRAGRRMFYSPETNKRMDRIAELEAALRGAAQDLEDLGCCNCEREGPYTSHTCRYCQSLADIDAALEKK